MAECKDPNLTYVDGKTIDCNDPKYRCLKWDDTECVLWNDSVFTWSDCILIEEIIPPDLPDNIGAPVPMPLWATSSLDELDEKDKKKKKRIIQLITYVKDQRIIEEKEVQDMKIDIDDVKLVKKKIDKTLNVSLGE
jgi:hypothetical protein